MSIALHRYFTVLMNVSEVSLLLASASYRSRWFSSRLLFHAHPFALCMNEVVLDKMGMLKCSSFSQARDCLKKWVQWHFDGLLDPFRQAVSCLTMLLRD